MILSISDSRTQRFPCLQEARGDRMCQDALLELKTAIKASGEHKQKVLIHIAVDGLKIRDEKTGVYFIKLD